MRSVSIPYEACSPLRGRVRGEVVDLAIVPEDDDPELVAEFEASEEDEKAGRLVDMKDVIALEHERGGACFAARQHYA